MKPMIFGIAAEEIKKGQAVAAVQTEKGCIYRLARRGDLTTDFRDIIQHEVSLMERLLKRETLLLDILDDRNCPDSIRKKIREAFTPVKTGTTTCVHGTPTDQRCILC